MKASEWINWVWKNIPAAMSIEDGEYWILVCDSVGEILCKVSIEIIEMDIDGFPIQRPVETERIPVVCDERSHLQYYLRYPNAPGTGINMATAYKHFLGYELADGTLSPRLEADMDVVAVVFRK